MLAQKRKMRLLIPSIIMCLACFSKNGFSQNAGTQKLYVKVGNTSVPANHRLPIHCTIEQILANPVLLPQAPDCEVTGFTISFCEAGSLFKGPFKTAGAAIRKEQIALLRGYKANELKRIFIEDIHVKYQGKEMDAESVLLYCD